ncbi:DUF5348 domain-containing protein [Aneurinibacillus tyrosinisolvens]
MDGHELSSGSPVELYVYDKHDERHDWVAIRIEHADQYGGYYA